VSQPARSFVTAALAIAVLFQVPAATQQTPQTQQPQPPPRFRTETNLVRVDVYATKDEVPVQDLTAADFELYEDNAPQKIDSFEHIVVTPAAPGAAVEPTSVTAANQAAADPRRRVFVVYLDIEHVDVTGSHAIKEPLIDLMTRVMGEDDLVAVMTPEMSPSGLTFGRRTEVIEQGLRKNWDWGRRNTIIPDEHEQLYEKCFPPANKQDTVPSQRAKAMAIRRRERMVLDSLQDLVRHMEAMREGRTAVITVSDGWVLYKPDPSLTTLRKDDRGNNADPLPGGPPPVGVGPGGQLTSRVRDDISGISDRTECEREQMELAMMDNERYFRDIFGEANRANVSFYPIDPRGLPVFDTPIGPDPPLPPAADHAQLTTRHESLRTLAINTDGIALLDNNDLKKQVRKIADDLTSYYLLGYYSSNGKLDGHFRNIKVRSKRPGVDIRARKGYKAATEEEVAKARASNSAPVPESKAALGLALGSIESDARAQGRTLARGSGEPVILHRGPSTGNQVQPANGRVFPRSERIRMEMEAAAGAQVWTATLLDRNGTATPVPVVAGERTDAATGQRWFTADLTLAPLGPGDYVVELTTRAGAEQKKTLVAIRVTP
jgi:VWFA-related protein